MTHVTPGAAAAAPFLQTTALGDRATLSAHVQTLVTDLWFEIDHHGGENAYTYFTPDAELRFANAMFTGAEQIRGAYRDRAARGARVSRHLVSNVRIHDVRDDSFRAVSVLVLYAEDGEIPRTLTTPVLVADVVDEFVFWDDRWLIRSRWINYLFIAPTTELAVPRE
ncbi:nuclear transport factor 2 family protein [Subtercola sp. YIM 133946]|uniref:nuclear transport factor 2 family protein n=1 Tax=Subtercola sp. YIM 133946 TaxID=3118909 RepID=UPI002F941F16